MAATQRRRVGLTSAVAAAGALLLGGPAPAGAGTAQIPEPAPPHGQLLQAADGTLYLLVAGRAHPITPTPLTDDALAAVPPGEALPDGVFWLVSTAAPPGPAQAATPRPSVAAFFATQTAVAPRSASSQRPAATAATATAQAGHQRPAAPTVVRARPSAAERPFGQS